MRFINNLDFSLKLVLIISSILIITLYLGYNNNQLPIFTPSPPSNIVIQWPKNFTDHMFVAQDGSQQTSLGIIALLVREDNLTLVGQRVAHIDESLRDNLVTPIIIFHQGYPVDTEIWELRRQTRRKVIFHNVDRYFSEFPAHFDPYVNQPNWWIRTKWNYQHMIHFWFKVVFELPLIQQYEYVMRLDTDSRVIGPWNDSFSLMKSSGAVYMANFETNDFEWRLRGTLKLKTLVDDFVKRTNLVVQDPQKFERAFTNESARTYWNNFEIAQVKFFRQKNVTDWVDTVIGSQGIYKYRWGDAILRFVTLAMFAREDQILHREKLGFGYCHPC